MDDFIVSMTRESQMSAERDRVRHELEQRGWQPCPRRPGLWRTWLGRIRSVLRPAVPPRAGAAARIGAGPMGCSV